MLLADISLEDLVLSLLRGDVFVDRLVQLLALLFQLGEVVLREGCLGDGPAVGRAPRRAVAIASLRHLCSRDQSSGVGVQHVIPTRSSFGQGVARAEGRPAGISTLAQ